MSTYDRAGQADDARGWMTKLRLCGRYWWDVLRLLALPVGLLMLIKAFALWGQPPGDWMFFVVMMVVVVELLAVFAWGLSRREGAWRQFRVWVGLLLGLAAACWCLYFFGKGTPPPKGTPRCGTGDMLMLVMLPMMALIFAFFGWIMFGAAKKTISVINPDFYKVEGVWTGASGVECGVGGMSLLDDDELEGLLSCVAPEGMLSLD